MTVSPAARVEYDEHLATVTLDRPATGNCLDDEMLAALRAAFDQVGAATRAAGPGEPGAGARAVLVQAEGRNFCFGGDVRSFAAAGADLPGALRRMTGLFHAAMETLAAVPVPVVAAVQGTAAGGGFSLACAADVVVAADSARFVFAYHRLGLSPDGGISWLLPRRLGPARALDWALSNRAVTAEEARAAGLVSRVVPDADVRDEARAVAAELASGPTRALAATKRLILESSGRSYQDHLREEAESMVSLGGSEDAATGVASFLARTAPGFTGR